MKRKRYKSPDQAKQNWTHILIRLAFTLCFCWVTYEAVMSSMLLE